MSGQQPTAILHIDFHSPEEELLHPLLQEKEVRLFVKRDDLIHPFISGNKWRKLKYVLARAQAENRRHLVTFGGAWSNHLVATACAGAKFGFNTTGFVRGEEVENPQLSLCRIFGMVLRFVDRTAYRDKKDLFAQHYGDDPEAYFIDEGGASIEATKGCAEIIGELSQQYDHLFCACGTGTTLAGLGLGIAGKELHTRLHGVPVLKGGDFIRQEVKKLTPHPYPFDLHTDYHFGGYAKIKPELTHFIRKFCSSSGILIEPVYTGKLFFAIFDLLEKDYFSHGDRILALHTGGLTGMQWMKSGH
ncbi:1-aminocyclopropane-1-carboxylate deaminase [bacterium A37T11]|nr:1-aminocyclopropane-1-carboxylate deaminase [bacterium A37T11]